MHWLYVCPADSSTLNASSTKLACFRSQPPSFACLSCQRHLGLSIFPQHVDCADLAGPQTSRQAFGVGRAKRGPGDGDLGKQHYSDRGHHLQNEWLNILFIHCYAEHWILRLPRNRPVHHIISFG